MSTNKNLDRRDFLVKAGTASLATGLSLNFLSSFANTGKAKVIGLNVENIPYKQTPLPYAYNALEPSIDAATMELHYSKHAASYAKSLAEAVQAENVNTSSVTLERLLGSVSKYTPKMRNNAGGHYNHELFWKMMSAPSGATAPTGKLLNAIQKDFSSIDAFKTQFADAAKTRFGSGWAWLVLGKDKKLTITSSPNQDNPLMDVSDVKGTPVLGLDVWEHAYYLKYQNRRPDYITAWWSVVNWNFVEKRFESM